MHRLLGALAESLEDALFWEPRFGVARIVAPIVTGSFLVSMRLIFALLVQAERP